VNKKYFKIPNNFPRSVEELDGIYYNCTIPSKEDQDNVWKSTRINQKLFREKAKNDRYQDMKGVLAMKSDKAFREMSINYFLIKSHGVNEMFLGIRSCFIESIGEGKVNITIKDDEIEEKGNYELNVPKRCFLFYVFQQSVSVKDQLKKHEDLILMNPLRLFAMFLIV